MMQMIVALGDKTWPLKFHRKTLLLYLRLSNCLRNSYRMILGEYRRKGVHVLCLKH